MATAASWLLPKKAHRAFSLRSALGNFLKLGLECFPSLFVYNKLLFAFLAFTQLINTYYKQHPEKDTEIRTEEADKVSVQITEILSEQTFSFSPAEYLTIHRRLFQGVYSLVGKIRDFNITGCNPTYPILSLSYQPPCICSIHGIIH